LILAILTSFSAIYIYLNIDFIAQENRLKLLIEPIGLSILYLFFAIFAFKYPKPVFIASLAVYLISTALLFIFNSEIIYSTIIFRIIVIFYIGKAVKAALDFEKLILKHHQLGGQKNW